MKITNTYLKEFGYVLGPNSDKSLGVEICPLGYGVPDVELNQQAYIQQNGVVTVRAIFGKAVISTHQNMHDFIASCTRVSEGGCTVEQGFYD